MIDETSTLLVSNIDFVAATKRSITSKSPRTPYVNSDIDAILWNYREVCRVSEVDIEFVLSQLCHETDFLRSEWSQPPKRNPAGIGVTGAVVDGVAVGQSFDTWLDAIQCHVGLILCYRFSASASGISAAQQRLINQCLTFRPGAPRGVGSTINDLAIKWAADTAYATRIVGVASAISKA
jgi:hypothetical protein